MKKELTYLLVLVVGMFCYSGICVEEPESNTSAAVPFRAALIYVYDGDTISVRSGGVTYLIRLWGIDAPESKQPDGKEATEYLKNLLKGGPLQIVPVDNGKYGRLVAKVYCGKIYINLQMIKAGHAWWYKQYASDAKDFEEAQRNAEQDKLGLWNSPDPINPGKWRKR